MAIQPWNDGVKGKKGLLIVHTGLGKGKTTAALGLLLRAWGRGMKVGGVQFFKHEKARFGEIRAAARMGIELIPMGDGFTWTSRDLDSESTSPASHGSRATTKVPSSSSRIGS